jgi:hypothetical protein
LSKLLSLTPNPWVNYSPFTGVDEEERHPKATPAEVSHPILVQQRTTMCCFVISNLHLHPPKKVYQGVFIDGFRSRHASTRKTEAKRM